MRSFLDNTLRSISEFLGKLSKKARTMLLVLIAIIIVFAIVVVVVLNRTKYVPLFYAQSASELNEIDSTLMSMNVPVRREGSTILVPENRVTDLKIMLQNDGYYSAGVDYSLLDQAGSFSVTDDLRQKLYALLCATEVRAQILMADKITGAEVKVNMGKTSAFAISRDASEATCSVTLILKSGATLSNNEAQTIAEIIRNSVQGIKYENITIADSKLNYYAIGDGNTDAGTELLSRLALEDKLTRQIRIQGEQFFTPVFGVHNVKIQPHVVLDFDQVDIESIEFFPPISGEMDGIVRSMSELYELQRVAGVAGGPPGTDTNGMGATEYPYGELGDGEDYKKFLSEKNFEINQTITTIKGERGKIKGLSIAILINSDAVEGDYTDEIRDLAAKGFGCAPASISVQRLPFAEREKTAEEVAAELQAIEEQERKRKLMETIIIWAVILILGLAFMALVRSIVKSVKEPDESEAAAAAAAEAAAALAGGGTINYLAGDGDMADGEDDYDDYDDSDEYAEEEEDIVLNAKSPGLEQIERFIEKDPASVASLLRNWLSDDE